MIRTALRVSFLLAALALGGCDAVAEQDAFEQDAYGPASGIARTDETGTLLSDDPDDWRTAPLYAFDFLITSRAFPNPVPASGRVVTIRMRTTDVIPGGLRLRAFRGGARLPWVGQQEEVPGPSIYEFSFFPGEITGARPGDLVRLTIFDGQGRVVTYGDLQIEG